MKIVIEKKKKKNLILYRNKMCHDGLKYVFGPGVNT